MSYLLDTNVCIALLKNKEALLIERFQKSRPDVFILCSIVKAELLYGARNSAQVERNLILLEKFFAQFDSLSFDDEAAEHYGLLRALLRRSGTPIGENNLLIASIAQANDVTVLTRNRSEFARVPGLRFECW